MVVGRWWWGGERRVRRQGGQQPSVLQHQQEDTEVCSHLLTHRSLADEWTTTPAKYLHQMIDDTLLALCPRLGWSLLSSVPTLPFAGPRGLRLFVCVFSEKEELYCISKSHLEFIIIIAYSMSSPAIGASGKSSKRGSGNNPALVIALIYIYTVNPSHEHTHTASPGS